MFLLDCNRNFHQNLYYFGLLSTDCLRIANLEDDGLQRTNFEPSLLRGILFLNFVWIRWYSLFTRWHSRGFLSNLWGRTIKNNIQKRVLFQIFYPTGAFIRLLQVFRDAGILLHVLLRSDSLCMRNAVFSGLHQRHDEHISSRCLEFSISVFLILKYAAKVIKWNFRDFSIGWKLTLENIS